MPATLQPSEKLGGSTYTGVFPLTWRPPAELQLTYTSGQPIDKIARPPVYFPATVMNVSEQI